MTTLFNRCLSGIPFPCVYRWTYSDSSKTQGVSFRGEIATYGPGGFYFDFPKDKMNAKTTIKDLKHDTWLNRGTRAVFVDFAIYNCNINVVCAIKYGLISNFFPSTYTYNKTKRVYMRQPVA